MRSEGCASYLHSLIVSQDWGVEELVPTFVILELVRTMGSGSLMTHDCLAHSTFSRCEHVPSRPCVVNLPAVLGPSPRSHEQSEALGWPHIFHPSKSPQVSDIPWPASAARTAHGRYPAAQPQKMPMRKLSGEVKKWSIPRFIWEGRWWGEL